MATLPVLTLVTHVYNAQAMVDVQLARWRAYSPALRLRLAFVIVDDCSATPLVADAQGLNLRLLRVNDDIAWNMPGCRNLLATQASTDWLLYFDIDNAASEASIQMLADALPRLDADRLHVFRRTENGADVDPHINTFLISRRGFFAAGGYDEDFCGHYGFEDVVFRNMWRKHVGDELMFTNIAFEQLGHRTTGLNRDTTRNQALAQYKLALGLPKPKGMLRFHWEELQPPSGAASADAERSEHSDQSEHSKRSAEALA